MDYTCVVGFLSLAGIFMLLKACLRVSAGLPNIEFIAATTQYAVHSCYANCSGFLVISDSKD